QHERHGAHEVTPFGRLGLQLAAAGCRELVELGLASELRRAPLGVDPAFALHSIESRVERSLFHLNRFFRRLFDPTGDGVSVPGAGGERFEHEGVERAVQTVFGRVHGEIPRESGLVYGEIPRLSRYLMLNDARRSARRSARKTARNCAL